MLSQLLFRSSSAAGFRMAGWTRVWPDLTCAGKNSIHRLHSMYGYQYAARALLSEHTGAKNGAVIDCRKLVMRMNLGAAVGTQGFR